MSFSGHIEDFPVIDIMQYIHASCKSGTLFFQNGELLGRLHFRDGQIIRATKPEMTNLGDLLRGRGLITSDQLQEAIRIQQVAPRPQPLGRILEEMGVINHNMLREAIIAQFKEVIYDLVGWEEGSFRFELETENSPDDISATPDDLFPPEEMDTQFLLLEAVRIFDEARNRRDEPGAPSEDPNQAPPPTDAVVLPASSGSEVVAPARLAKDSLSGFDIFKKMLREGRKSEQTHFISSYFLKILSEDLARAILFLVRKSELLGLGAIGKTPDDHSLQLGITNLRIPIEPDSLLQHCLEARSPFQGTPPAQPWLQSLYRQIGRPRTSEVVILPVAGVARVICLVYGDHGNCPQQPYNLEMLELAANLTGLIFENTFMRKQLQRETH
jgi:hypothetical protein